MLRLFSTCYFLSLLFLSLPMAASESITKQDISEAASKPSQSHHLLSSAVSIAKKVAKPIQKILPQCAQPKQPMDSAALAADSSSDDTTNSERHSADSDSNSDVQSATSDSLPTTSKPAQPKLTRSSSERPAVSDAKGAAAIAAWKAGPKKAPTSKRSSLSLNSSTSASSPVHSSHSNAGNLSLASTGSITAAAAVNTPLATEASTQTPLTAPKPQAPRHAPPPPPRKNFNTKPALPTPPHETEAELKAQAKRKADEEQARRLEETRKQAAEAGKEQEAKAAAEAQRKADADAVEQARKQKEAAAEAKRIADEEAAAAKRIADEEQARRLEEARKQKEEDDDAREAQAKRKAYAEAAEKAATEAKQKEDAELARKQKETTDALKMQFKNHRIDLTAKNKRGHTALHSAADENDVNAMEALLALGASLDVRGKDYQTPLHTAASAGSKEAVKYLLQKGANVTARDKDGNTPLHYAANSVRPNGDVIRCLHANEGDIEAKNENKETPIQIAVEFCLENVECLKDLGAKLDVVTDCYFRYTLMHLAARRRKLDIVRYLAKNGVSVNAGDKNGETPLHKAVSMSDLALRFVSKFDTGTDDSIGFLIGKPDTTIKDVVICLKELGASLETQGDDYTPLHWAARLNHVEAITALVEVGAQLETKSKHFGSTALHTAAGSESVDAIELLVKLGANKNAKNDSQKTPMHSAAWAKKREAIRCLKKLGADIDATAGYYKETPLWEAVRSGSIKTIRCLNELGANINATGHEDRTVLHELMTCTFLKAEKKAKVAECLIELGADVNAHQVYRGTPLDVAVSQEFNSPSNNNELAIKVLKKHGAKKSSNCIVM